MMCLRTSAKGWRRVHDIYDDLATVLRCFLSHKKSITCLKLWRTVREEFVMHARTLGYHATVRDGLANRFANPLRTRRIPVR